MKEKSAGRFRQANFSVTILLEDLNVGIQILDFNMRRLLISFTGGVFIPLLLFALAMMMGERLEHNWGMGWLANVLMFSVVGPMVIWERVFPHLPACPSCGPTDTAIVATIVTVFLFYSVLTFSTQLVIDTLRRRDVKL